MAKSIAQEQAEFQRRIKAKAAAQGSTARGQWSVADEIERMQDRHPKTKVTPSRNKREGKSTGYRYGDYHYVGYKAGNRAHIRSKWVAA